jgi:hypothetical protein
MKEILLKNIYFSNIVMSRNTEIEKSLNLYMINSQQKNQRKWINLWENNMNYVYLTSFIIKLMSYFMKTIKE